MTKANTPARRWPRLAAALLAGAALLNAGTALANPEEVLNRYYAQAQQDPAAAFAALAEAAPRYPDDPRIQLEAGYYLLKQDRRAEALPWFERAVALQPERADLWKQVGYIRKALGQRSGAITAFERAAQLDPADRPARAELAYLRSAGGAWGPAEKGEIFGETYAAPEYNSYWDMAVLPVQARVGVVLADAPVVEAYVGVRLNVDSRSGKGPFGPQVYTDNMAAVAAGLRLRPLPGLALFVEGGAAYDLVDRGRTRWRGDVRGGFLYYNDWNMAPREGGGIRPVADVYADGIYYSRYDDNVLFTGRVRPGLRLAENERWALDAYLHAAAGFDTKGLRDNEFEELGGGAAVRLFGPAGLTFRAEGVRVFRHGGLPSYSTARIRLEHYARF
ncbi:tetratricopeptide repeat protein [Novosphingobium arvoryzae]|uniref:tetratricopeptide repeat protein n=1 Tax=Novosphingobium arvoryzae TaxID=1256514 RepID=UPI0035B174CD